MNWDSSPDISGVEDNFYIRSQAEENNKEVPTSKTPKSNPLDINCIISGLNKSPLLITVPEQIRTSDGYNDFVFSTQSQKEQPSLDKSVKQNKKSKKHKLDKDLTESHKKKKKKKKEKDDCDLKDTTIESDRNTSKTQKKLKDDSDISKKETRKMQKDTSSILFNSFLEPESVHESVYHTTNQLFSQFRDSEAGISQRKFDCMSQGESAQSTFSVDTTKLQQMRSHLDDIVPDNSFNQESKKELHKENNLNISSCFSELDVQDILDSISRSFDDNKLPQKNLNNTANNNSVLTPESPAKSKLSLIEKKNSSVSPGKKEVLDFVPTFKNKDDNIQKFNSVELLEHQEACTNNSLDITDNKSVPKIDKKKKSKKKTKEVDFNQENDDDFKNLSNLNNLKPNKNGKSKKKTHLNGSVDSNRKKSKKPDSPGKKQKYLSKAWIETSSSSDDENKKEATDVSPKKCMSSDHGKTTLLDADIFYLLNLPKLERKLNNSKIETVNNEEVTLKKKSKKAHKEVEPESTLLENTNKSKKKKRKSSESTSDANPDKKRKKKILSKAQIETSSSSDEEIKKEIVNGKSSKKSKKKHKVKESAADANADFPLTSVNEDQVPSRKKEKNSHPGFETESTLLENTKKSKKKKRKSNVSTSDGDQEKKRKKKKILSKAQIETSSSSDEDINKENVYKKSSKKTKKEQPETVDDQVTPRKKDKTSHQKVEAESAHLENTNNSNKKKRKLGSPAFSDNETPRKKAKQKSPESKNKLQPSLSLNSNAVDDNTTFKHLNNCEIPEKNDESAKVPKKATKQIETESNLNKTGSIANKKMVKSPDRKSKKKRIVSAARIASSSDSDSSQENRNTTKETNSIFNSSNNEQNINANKNPIKTKETSSSKAPLIEFDGECNGALDDLMKTLIESDDFKIKEEYYEAPNIRETSTIRKTDRKYQANAQSKLKEQIEKQSRLYNKIGDDDLQLLKYLVVESSFEIPELHRIETFVMKVPTPAMYEEIAALGVPVKKGVYSPEETELVMNNWTKFYRKHDMPANPELFMNLNVKDANGKRLLPREEGKKFAQFLAQGLPNRTLHSVFSRFKTIYSTVKRGKFSQEEDELIVETLETSKDSRHIFARLGKELNRDGLSVEKRYIWLRDQGTHDFKVDKISHRESNLIVQKMMKEMECKDINELKYAQIPLSVFNKIGEEIQLRPIRIKHHWLLSLHPKLFVTGTRQMAEVKAQLIDLILANPEYKTMYHIKYQDFVPLMDGWTSLALSKIMRNMMQVGEYANRLLEDFRAQLILYRRDVLKDRSELKRASFIDGQLYID